MEKLLILEDWEREADKELIYLYNKEHELWLWYESWLPQQEGTVEITEKIKEKEEQLAL